MIFTPLLKHNHNNLILNNYFLAKQLAQVLKDVRPTQVHPAEYPSLLTVIMCDVVQLANDVVS